MGFGRSQDRFTLKVFRKIEVLMRILDNDSDKKIENITICLTLAEAQKLKDTLAQILIMPTGNHGHVTDANAEREITLCVYDESNLDSGFHDRIKRLIEKDE